MRLRIIFEVPGHQDETFEVQAQPLNDCLVIRRRPGPKWEIDEEATIELAEMDVLAELNTETSP